MQRCRSTVLAAALVAALAVSTVALTACGSNTGSTAVGGGLLSKRTTPPKIDGTTLDGGSLNVAGLRGKVVVLNFYASWCAPCRAETPMLQQTAAEFASKGVDLVGVLTADTATNGRTFRHRYGVTYPSLQDPDRTLLAKFKDVNAAGLPTTFVLDRKGKLAARYTGPISDTAAFHQVLTTLAAEPA